MSLPSRLHNASATSWARPTLSTAWAPYDRRPATIRVQGRANALNYLGTARSLTGDYPGAARSLEESLNIDRELGDRLGQANALTDLGKVNRRTHRHWDAAQTLALTYLGAFATRDGGLPGRGRGAGDGTRHLPRPR